MEYTAAGCEVATPDAPSRTAYGGDRWFHVDGMQLDPVRIQEARAAFDGSIKTVVSQEGFDDNIERVALVAVFQGAIVALDAVATGRWKGRCLGRVRRSSPAHAGVAIK